MQISPWRASRFSLTAVLALVLVACGGGDGNGDDGTSTPEGTPGGTQAPTATQAPDDVQVLNVNLRAEPTSLDPQRATDAVSASVLRNLYSGLLTLTPDLELEADVAEEVPTVENGGISADGLTYTFRLREGLTWSDGTPLVAQAFVDGAKRLFEPGTANPYAGFYRMIASDGPDGDANLAVERALAEGAEGEALMALEQAVVDGLRVEAPDDRTVVYHLNRESPVFLVLSSLWPLYPVRQDLVDAHGEQWTEAGTLVSNGPFALETWAHSQEIRLVRNEHWHHDDVALQAVRMAMIPDQAVAFLSYQNDELDLLALGPTELVQVRSDADLQEQFASYAEMSTVGVFFNVADPIFARPEARQAFAGAFDRTEYAEALREGAVLPAFSFVPPGMPGHDAELGLEFDDLGRSRELLAEAGAEGATISILSPQVDSAIVTAEWLQQQWQQNLGVTVVINAVDPGSYFEERARGQWQVVIGGWVADYPDPDNWLPLFRTGSGFNAGGYSSAEYDALLDEAATELDQDRRLELYQEAQAILIEEAGFSPLYYGRRNILVKPWVQGLAPSPMEGVVPGDLYFERVSISGRP